MKRNSPYLTEINRAIGGLDREGTVARLFSYYVPDECPVVSEAGAIKPLALGDLGGVFLLAGVASGLSLCAKMSYMLCSWRPKVKRLRQLGVGDGKNVSRGRSTESGSEDSRIALTAFRSDVGTGKQSVVTAGRITPFNLERSLQTSVDGDSPSTNLTDEHKPFWPEKQIV